MSRRTTRGSRRGAGKAIAGNALTLTLEEHFAAHSLIGLLASQTAEPDPKWASDWSFRMGATMAREAMRRRRKK
jgi:hypothetical protein